jgi:hypothetical protein
VPTATAIMSGFRCGSQKTIEPQLGHPAGPHQATLLGRCVVEALSRCLALANAGSLGGADMIRHLLRTYDQVRFGRAIAYGRLSWPSYSVWIIPGTIDDRA